VLGLKVIRNFIDSAVVSFSDVPLKLATALGLLFSSVAFVYLLWMLMGWLGGREVAGWSATLVAVLFLGGVQLVSVGVLGTYIASIFLETKGRPNFIIRECAGFDSSPEGGRRLGRRLADAPTRTSRGIA
jgi:polyisoprenyl-phosphate glycosyltransferase